MSENSNFVCLTRSLIEKSAWVDARPTHQTVFMHILLRCAFKETEHNIQGNIIIVLPGQLCATIRQIQDWSGKWISKNDVEGSIKYFQKVNFLRQEIRHGKTLITIIESDVYNTLTRSNQTGNQTEVRQESDRSQTQKKNVKTEEERKEEYISREALNEKIVGLDFYENFEQASLNPNNSLIKNESTQHNVYNQKLTKLGNSETKSNKTELNKTKKKQKPKVESDEYRASLVQRRGNIFTSEEEHKDLVEKEGSELTEKFYDELSAWKKSKSLNNPKDVNSHSDFYRIKKWVISSIKNSNPITSLERKEEVKKTNDPKIQKLMQENKTYAKELGHKIRNPQIIYTPRDSCLEIKFKRENLHDKFCKFSYNQHDFQNQVISFLRDCKAL